MTFVAAFENAGDGVSAVIFLFIVVVGACLAIAWIIFPFIFANDFEDARKQLKTVGENLAVCHRALNESNRALQWIVDDKSNPK